MAAGIAGAERKGNIPLVLTGSKGGHGIVTSIDWGWEVYDYRFDAARNLLDISWKGMFSDTGVRDYAALLKREFVRHGFRPGYRLRMDMSDSAVQPQFVLAAFREAFADFPRASRIAVITQSTIAKMQIQREMTQSYLRIFDSAEAGLDWLLEPVPA